MITWLVIVLTALIIFSVLHMCDELSPLSVFGFCAILAVSVLSYYLWKEQRG